MKKWKKMTAFMVTMVMAVSMAACGGDEPAAEKMTSGHYLMYSLVYGEVAVAQDMLEDVEMAESYLTLHGDGTADFYLQDMPVEKMEVDEKAGIMVYDDGSEMDMKIDGDFVILSFEQDGSPMIWTFALEGSDVWGTAPSGGDAVASGEMAVLDYNGDGEVFFEYPADAFAFEHKYGLDYLNAADGSVSISFVADWDMEEYAATMEGYQKYVDENGGIMEEGLNFGGYEAVRVTYESVFSVDQYTYIFFADDMGKYVGISACASADDQAGLDTNAGAIDAILNSVYLN